MSNTLLSAPLGAVAAAPPAAGYALRPAAQKDASAIAKAYLLSYDGAWTFEEALEDVERAFANGHGQLLADASRIAVDSDSTCIGAVFTVLDPPWKATPPGPFIIDVFVVPAARGRGIGRSLMTAAMAAAPGATIALRVEDDNAAAIALYGSLGFTRGDNQRGP